MKIQVDGEQVFELNETKKKVICNEIPADVFESDMKRRVRYIIEHKYERCFKRLKEEWEPILKTLGIESIPLDNDKFAELVFKQPDYKDRKAQDKE